MTDGFAGHAAPSMQRRLNPSKQFSYKRNQAAGISILKTATGKSFLSCGRTLIPFGANCRGCVAVAKMQQRHGRVFQLSEKIHQGLVRPEFSVLLAPNPFTSTL
ncbi:hypothetical protein [Sphingopyxis sp. RIFCSPHIGHO2_12_FULL_65_19]|uniref:hypothetical protein n=1 Tax=Sphingopyxis sp. RIFCSPHIGHO2_12_FULL_65_19 TaxID=1802172 RepID=UPI0025DF0FA5|nr:hypothetical protein [Sphingopyxis sp. RIFCSPHIGHO2_12_FULL_65_19]